MVQISIPKRKLHEVFDDIKNSGFLSEGKYTGAFQREVEAWSGLHAAPVSNCGTGLFTILRCLPKRSGIAVVSTNTFFATGAMAREAGYTVVGADCGRDDFCLTAATLQRYAPASTDVVILTHVGGGLAHDYAAIALWCQARGIHLVEDAAHLLGLGGDGSAHIAAGTLGTAAAFSLYATKPMNVGEGGVIVTRSSDLAEKMRRFANYGKYGSPVRYTGVGFNLRLSEWAAGVAYLQMQRRREMMELRGIVADKLKRIVDPMVRWPTSTWYKYIVPADFPSDRVTGKVYAASDQLDRALGLPGVFPNAAWVAANHKCLPVEEHMFSWTVGRLERFLGV